MTSSDPREAFLRRYQVDDFRFPAMVNHRGAVVAFAMGSEPERRIYYTILDLNEGDSTFDNDHWLQAPRELPFPTEIAEVGYGIAGETRLPQMLLPTPGKPRPVTEEDNVLPSEIDAYWSSTGRLTADAPFEVLSDDQYIYVFRQAVGRDGGIRTVPKSYPDGRVVTEIFDGKEREVPLVDRTLLVDRYLLGSGRLMLKREVRFRRSGSRTRPESAKDSLGAKDMDGNAFYESTQELSFIRNLVKGRFSVTQLPTAVAEVSRWQLFACSGKTEDDGTVDDTLPVHTVDSYNIERSADGRFDARGTQIYTSPEPEYQSAVYEREPGTCPFTGRPLIPKVSTSGYAEYALALDGGAHVQVPTSSSLSPDNAYTVELWIRLTAAEGEQGLFARSEEGEGELVLDDGVPTYREGGATATSSVTVPTDVWTHIALTRRDRAVSILINGEVAGGSDMFPTYVAPKSALTIGGGLLGTIEEIRIWDHARHVFVVNERRSNRLIGNEPGLRALWRLDEGGGADLPDQTDHQNDATLVVDQGTVDAVWVASDAPIGDNPGIRRSSFFVADRAVVTGMSAVTYQESEMTTASSTTEPKPLKQLTRTMLALVTAPSEVRTAEDDFDPESDEAKPVVSIVDFAVSREGRLAQVSDRIELRALPSTFLGSIADGLSQHGAALYALARQLDPDADDETPASVGDDTDPVRALSQVERNLRALDKWAESLVVRTSAKQLAAAQTKEDEEKQTRSTAKGQRTRLENAITEAAEAETAATTARDAAQQAVATADADLTARQSELDAVLDDEATVATVNKATAARDKAQAAVDTANANLTARQDELDVATAAYATVATDNEPQIAALTLQIDDLDETIDALERLRTDGPEVNTKAGAIRNELAADSDALDDVGDARPMHLIDVDRLGLTTIGGRLDFAWTSAAPLLTVSADGEIALYYQGRPADGASDGQFFAAYYDTNTARVSEDLALEAPAGQPADPDALFIRFFSRSTEREREGSTIAVSDDGDDTVTVTIAHPSLFGAPYTETWRSVPRIAGHLADVVNGLGDEPRFLGTLSARTWNSVTDLQLSESVRRSLRAGDVISINGQRTRVRVDASRSSTRILIDEITLSDPVMAGTSVYQIPYDYDANMTREGADLRGHGSSLFRAAAGYPQGRVLDASVEAGPSGRTSQWVARSPGKTYRYDGNDLLTNTTDPDTDVSRWQTDGDVTLEAWVLHEELPEPRDGQAFQDVRGMVMYHEAPRPGGRSPDVETYGLWLEPATNLVELPPDQLLVFLVRLFRLWFPWLRVPKETVLTEDPTAFHIVAQAGTRRIRSVDPVLYGRWHQLAVAYRHSFGVEIEQGAWIDGGPGASLSLPGDLTLELFFRIDNLTDGGLITRGRFGQAIQDGVPYSVRVDGSEVVLEFELPGGARKSFRSTGAGIRAGRFYRVGVVRERVRETVEGTKTVNVEYENEDGEAETRSVEVPEVEVIEYTAIRFYVLAGSGTGARLRGDHRYGGAEAGDNRSHTEIGRASTAGGQTVPFKGAFSEVRVWARALSEAEVCKDGGFAGSEDLVAWWRFEENRGRTVEDAIGENTATLYHGATTGGDIVPARWVPSPDPNGPSLVLYRNGQVVRTVNLDAERPHGTPQFSIGGRIEGAESRDTLTGTIEEVRVWGEVRTQEQIQDNLFTRLRGELKKLIAYYPFDDVYVRDDGAEWVGDRGARGNHLLLGAEDSRPVEQISTAPISFDTAQVRSALAGIRTDFHDTMEGRPGVVEYGDLQRDDDGVSIGVLKRCYTYVKGGVWHLVTGYKVGDLRAEWVGQVQFNPQVMGFIEGAPPTPSENLTLGPVTEFGSYAGRTSVELVRTDGTTYTLSSSSSSGYDLSFSAKAEFGSSSSVNLITAPLGIGTWVQVLDYDFKAGFGGKVNAGASWNSEQTSSSKIEIERSSSLELAGSWESANAVLNSAVGPRWVPANIGMALVQSETADVFAMRLEHSGALVSLMFRPNPDIPPDWNIINFPINPRYTKQGTLDGSVGYDSRGKVLDKHYQTALDYGEYSYYKPREAYAIKRDLDRQQQSVRAYYEDFQPEPSVDLMGLMGDGIGVVGKALGSIGLSNSFAEQISGVLGSTAEKNRVADDFSRRSFANTYVWTADGGFFSEATNITSTFQETTGGNYQFSGEVGANFSLQIASPIAVTLEMNMAMGGNLSYTRSKSRESESSVRVNVVCNNEGDLQQYGGPRHLDGQYDPISGQPLLVPGKVDAYRFMTFFLEPHADNYEDLFNKVIDPIWLEQSSAPNAIALRQAQQDTTRPPCWRIFHRVTFVSRILPDFGSPAASAEERAMKELDINSNYELVQRMDPFVRHAITDFTRFSDVVRGTLQSYFPELLPHQDSIVEFLALYYGIEEGMPEMTPGAAPPDKNLPPSGAETLDELAEDDGADHLFTFSEDTGVNDRIGSMTVHLPGRGDVVATSETALLGALALEESRSIGLIELGDRWGRDHDRSIEVVFRLDGSGRSGLIHGGRETPDVQRPFEHLSIALGATGPLVFKALPDSSPTLLPGLTREAALGRLVYLVIGFDLAKEEFRLTWMIQGGNEIGSAVAPGKEGSISGGRLFLGNPALDVTAHGPSIEFHHLAVYPELLSEAHVMQRIGLLGLDQPFDADADADTDHPESELQDAQPEQP